MGEFEKGKKVRKKILYIIINSPGAYIIEIMEQMEISQGLLSYHVSKLLERGAIFVKCDGKYKHLFPIYMKNEAIPVMLTSKKKTIYSIVKGYPGSTYKDIVTLCGMEHSSIKYYIKKLRKIGLIRTKRIMGKCHFYAEGEHLLFRGHRHLGSDEVKARYQKIKKSMIPFIDRRIKINSQWGIAKENRAMLLRHITNYPGLHSREIGRHFNLSIRQMRSAISALENEKEMALSNNPVMTKKKYRLCISVFASLNSKRYFHVGNNEHP